ncbi:MAG: DUF2314 domain-containing protein [Acidobacteriota bacterium]
MTNGPVSLTDDDDPMMARASAHARSSFKYFWRELYWERRRTIPALDMAVIKLPFQDGEGEARADGKPAVEHMWVDEVQFDGLTLSGVLINAPNWIRSVRQGDRVRAPFERLGDWMYSIGDVVHGGYTINLLRSRMPVAERTSHDRAWGLDFGNPDSIRLFPYVPADDGSEPQSGFLPAEKDPAALPFEDHPACQRMLDRVEQAIAADPSSLAQTGDDGLTTLHREALAGNLGIVQLLLKHGCDPEGSAAGGNSLADLTEGVGWPTIAEALRTHGSTT